MYITKKSVKEIKERIDSIFAIDSNFSKVEGFVKSMGLEEVLNSLDGLEAFKKEAQRKTYTKKK